MSSDRRIEQQTEPQQVPLGMLVFTILVVAIGFFLAKHDIFYSLIELSSVNESIDDAANRAGDLVAKGSLVRPIGLGMLAVFGFWMFILPGGRRFDLGNVTALMLTLSFSWCVASVVWSSDPVLTFKRVVALGFIVIAALGISRRLSPVQIAMLALGVSLIFTLIGILAEMALGQFNPFANEYRFAGTLHPTHQGQISACLALSAFSLLMHKSPYRNLILMAAILGCTMLLLTRTRASVIGLIAGVSAVWLLQSTSRVRLTALVTTGWIATLALLYVSVFGINEQAVDIAALGRTESIASLSGRIPLWIKLTSYIEAQPLQGYGYSAFWNPDRIAEIARSINWTAPSAHSAYFSIVLYLGFTGLAMLLPAILLGAYRLYQKYTDNHDAGVAFMFGLIAFGFGQSIFASNFAEPEFVTFLALCGLAHVAFFAKHHRVFQPAMISPPAAKN